MPIGDTHLCRIQEVAMTDAMEGGIRFPKPIRATLLCTGAAIALVSGALLAAGGMSAQAYPSKLIRVICPIPAGSVLDVTARLVTPELSARVGVPVIVDNRPGGGGTTGIKEFART